MTFLYKSKRNGLTENRMNIEMRERRKKEEERINEQNNLLYCVFKYDIKLKDRGQDYSSKKITKKVLNM